MIHSPFIMWTGSALARLPNESSVSSLLWLAWRNSVRAKDVRRLCTGRTTSNPRHTFLRPKWIDAERVFRQTNWQLPSVREKSVLRRLEPVAPGWLCEQFRFCPICLESGYHSFWFQFVPLRICPLHDVRLTTACSCCGKVIGSYAIVDALFHTAFRCQKCGAPLAGAPLSLFQHVELRHHAKQFEEAFSLLNRWALSEESVWHIAADFAAQNQDLIRRKAVGQSLVCGIVRALQPLPDNCFDPVPACPVFALNWDLNPASRGSIWTDHRLSWEERVRTATPVYRVVLRGLRRWIEDTGSTGINAGRENSALDVPSILNLSILAGAYSLLRRKVEGRWCSFSSPWNEAQIVEPPISMAIHAGRYQRLICANLYLAMFCDCVYELLEAKKKGARIEPDFNLRSGLEVFAIKRKIGSRSKGAIVFPGIFKPDGKIWTRASLDLEPLKAISDGKENVD